MRTIDSARLLEVTGGFHRFPSEACVSQFKAYQGEELRSYGPDRLLSWMVKPIGPVAFDPRHPQVKATQDAWQACEAAQP